MGLHGQILVYTRVCTAVLASTSTIDSTFGNIETEIFRILVGVLLNFSSSTLVRPYLEYMYLGTEGY